MNKCIIPGTFDPIHKGHVAIIQRASKLFDSVIVGVAATSSKTPKYSLDQRFAFAQEKCGSIENVTVKTFDGLLVDFVKNEKADCVVRGLRNVDDFEYEASMLSINQKLSQGFETLYMISDMQNINVSSSQIRELESLGIDTKNLLN